MTEINGTLNWMKEEKKKMTKKKEQKSRNKRRRKKSNDSCGKERREKINQQIVHTARPAQGNKTKCKEKESVYAIIIIIIDAYAGLLCVVHTKYKNTKIQKYKNTKYK